MSDGTGGEQALLEIRLAFGTHSCTHIQKDSHMHWHRLSVCGLASNFTHHVTDLSIARTAPVSSMVFVSF